MIKMLINLTRVLPDVITQRSKICSYSNHSTIAKCLPMNVPPIKQQASERCRTRAVAVAAVSLNVCDTINQLRQQRGKARPHSYSSESYLCQRRVLIYERRVGGLNAWVAGRGRGRAEKYSLEKLLTSLENKRVQM